MRSQLNSYYSWKSNWKRVNNKLKKIFLLLVWLPLLFKWMPYNRFVFVSRKKTISLCSIHSTQYLFFSQQMYWDNRIFFNYVNNRICARTEYYEILMLNIYTLRGNANKMCKRWDRGTKLKFVWKHTRLLCWLVCSMFNLYSVVWKTLKMLWHCLSRGGCNVSVTSRQSATSLQPEKQ